jgi:hypothetical protein
LNGVGSAAPKAGGLLKAALLFSTLPLKQNNLVVIVACGWQCGNVPECFQDGHKSWHTLQGRHKPPPSAPTTERPTRCVTKYRILRTRPGRLRWKYRCIEDSGRCRMAHDWCGSRLTGFRAKVQLFVGPESRSMVHTVQIGENLSPIHYSEAYGDFFAYYPLEERGDFDGEVSELGAVAR